MSLTPADAFGYFGSRGLQPWNTTQYIYLFETKNGRHIAMSREESATLLFLEQEPPAIAGVEIHRRYAADDPRNSNINIRGSRLAIGKPVVRVKLDSAAALGALIDWYSRIAPDAPDSERKLCLIGTWSGFDIAELSRIEKFISAQAGWASWWSFRIKDLAAPRLEVPYWLYINQGSNRIVARFRVKEARSDSAPFVSPWREQTEPEWVDKAGFGEGATNQCRTWLLVDSVEWLTSRLSIDDFDPAEGLSQRTSLLNQSTFGYAFRKSVHAAPTNEENNMTSDVGAREPLNRILYGPPGTSKTYATIDRALRIVDPSFFEQNSESRTRLRTRFEELRKTGQIEFVTFHQSYSYEDFVEGLKASTEDGRVRYSIEDGIFKQICLRAQAAGGDEQFREALNEFKRNIAEEPVELKTQTGRPFTITWRGGKTLRLRPSSSRGEADYPVSSELIERLYRGESEEGFYNVSYVRAVLKHVVNEWKVPPYSRAGGRKPYVLIIDEINRGNIASIFGELITLLEPSKREGAPEALSTPLPYSKDDEPPFSVPGNLYVIGTMNTADRSLTRVDTALRRRFEFEAMYPKPELLDHVEIEGINVGKMLRKINERIEVLYDRDHTIGHAYFSSLMDGSDRRSLSELAEIFRNRVLPLLEEYFFDNWEKIHLVLADNRKSHEFQFIRVIEERDAADLFGESDEVRDLASLKRYQVNEAAFARAESYRKIY